MSTVAGVGALATLPQRTATAWSTERITTRTATTNEWTANRFGTVMQPCVAAGAARAGYRQAPRLRSDQLPERRRGMEDRAIG